MPTYSYACPRGHTFEYVCSMKDHKRARKCECGSVALQIIDRPVFGWAQRDCRYDSPIDGRPITSWAQRRDDLARNGCQEYDPEMKKDADRARMARDAALDRSVDITVESAYEKLSGPQRERLGNELASGIDVAITRPTPEL